MTTPTPPRADDATTTTTLPDGLVAHCETSLRKAYEHAARERRAQMEDDDAPPSIRANAPTSAELRGMARGEEGDDDDDDDDEEDDDDARAPPDPTDGIERVMEELKELAVAAVAAAAAAAADDEDDDDEAAAEEEEEEEEDAKRRKIHAAAAAAAAAASTSPPPPTPLGGIPAPTHKQKKRLARQSVNAAAVFNTNARILTSAMRGSWAMTRALLVTKTLPAAAAVSAARAAKDRSAWRRHVIVSHHVALRSQCAIDDVVHAEDTWRDVIGKEGSLDAYAEAAEEVGNRAWVLTALRWCAREIERFAFEDGALEYEIRRLRARWFEEKGEKMSDAEEAAARASRAARLSTRGGGLVPTRWHVQNDPHVTVKPLIVDVGSCWDYFRRHDDAFEVIAQDLRPRKDAMLRSDFLELVIQDDAAAAPGISERAPPGGGPRDLTSLPRGCATAVVMSLVLSYVPTPKLRGEMARRARELLADEGRGLFLVVTPHSTDKSHNPRNALPILREWKDAIESLGFERVRLERQRAVHVMAFRTVGAGGAACGEGDAPPLRIAFDGPQEGRQGFVGGQVGGDAR